eukprot:CAMPEP_0171642690 /NCGR_PEP_ID=MMETSP0990-20121206/32146_1 /TAXON_ID=483369 /ORGANISM="non described non described, Strain CCMP2098" /LENGTH=211 /DNA_ID=CAMNT_0012218041 /DNA_START=372 /DNA_END=1007 /DNA_ORIENTATION=-
MILALLVETIESSRPSVDLHVDEVWCELPYSAVRSGRGAGSNQRPDLVLVDRVDRTIDVVEVTVVPRPALRRYIELKRAKYASFATPVPTTADLAKKCGSLLDGPPPRLFQVQPPMVLAFSTDGFVPESNREALLHSLKLGQIEADDFLKAASTLACGRADVCHHRRVGFADKRKEKKRPRDLGRRDPLICQESAPPVEGKKPHLNDRSGG